MKLSWFWKTIHFHSKNVCHNQVAISAYRRCSVRLYLQLLVGGLIYYLHCLCLFANSGVRYILCCVFFLSSYCVPYVASSSGLSIFDCPLWFSLTIINYENEKQQISHYRNFSRNPKEKTWKEAKLVPPNTQIHDR